jgi:hypothetical protein
MLFATSTTVPFLEGRQSRCAVGSRDGHNTGGESIAYDVTFNDMSIPSVSASYAVQLAARFHGRT